MACTYPPTEDEDTSKIPDVSIIESSAEMLYGLVHQRYILTRVGLQAMVRRSVVFFLEHKMILLCIGGKVRSRCVRYLPSCLLCRLQCRPMWACGHPG